MKQLVLSLSAAAALLGVIEARAADGAALYQQNCVGCHQPQGAGAPGIAPPLGASLAARGATDKGRSYLTQVLVHGLSGRIVVDGMDYIGAMPSQAHLSDDDIAAVLSHVVSGFKPDASGPVSAAEVAAARQLKPTAKELRALREATKAQ